MKLPTATLSVRIPHELWVKLAHFVEEGLANDLSSAVRNLVESGLWLHEHEDDIRDTEKTNKIIDEWKAKMNEKEILDLPKQFSDDQIKALEMAFALEKERRYKL